LSTSKIIATKTIVQSAVQIAFIINKQRQTLQIYNTRLYVFIQVHYQNTVLQYKLTSLYTEAEQIDDNVTKIYYNALTRYYDIFPYPDSHE